jgi:hypothetical protein
MTSTLRPESFRLPEGFASGGDPVKGNPFHPDDPRHRVWRDATRVAEQEVARINVDFFACLERVEREQNAAEEAGGTIAQDSLLLAAWARDKACPVSTFLAQFDAWAKQEQTSSGPTNRWSEMTAGSNNSRMAGSIGFRVGMQAICLPAKRPNSCSPSAMGSVPANRRFCLARYLGTHGPSQ